MTTSAGSRLTASTVRRALARHDVITSGIVTGMLGGTAMLALAGFAAGREGLRAAHALTLIGEAFVGPDALEPTARIAFGLVVHMFTAATLGVAIAALLPRDHPIGCSMGLGLGLALLAMALMMSFVVPWANPGLRSGLQVIGGSWVIAHAVFGLCVGLTPPLRRRLARRVRASQEIGRARNAAPATPPRERHVPEGRTLGGEVRPS